MNTSNKLRPGRRSYDKRTVRREIVTFKASKEEKARWQRAARASGLSLGAWLARLADLGAQVVDTEKVKP